MSVPETKPKMLLVDDDPMIIELLELRLITQGYEVKTAMDGQAAYEALKNFSPDIIVCDVVMPRLDGLSLCRRLRSENNLVPFLFLTAKGQPKEKVEVLSAGADDYLVKPFDPHELGARILSILRRKETGNT